MAVTSGVVPRFSLKTPSQGLLCGLAVGSAFGASAVLLYYTLRYKPSAVSKPDTASTTGADRNGGLGATPRELPTQSPIEGLPSNMVLLVRTDLKLGRGKVAVQCGHAVHQQYRKLRRKREPHVGPWEANSAPIVCLRVRDEEELLVYQEKAKLKGLSTCCVVDGNPNTHNAPGTRTVVAIGPGDATDVTELTKDLLLF